jgi:exodeoxyribonuclease VII small subunit
MGCALAQGSCYELFPSLAACLILVVDSENRPQRDLFFCRIRRRIARLWGKEPVKKGALRPICSRRFQSPTGCWAHGSYLSVVKPLTAVMGEIGACTIWVKIARSPCCEYGLGRVLRLPSFAPIPSSGRRKPAHILMSKTEKTPSDASASREPKDFESALKELEALALDMEDGGLSLEESLAAYKRGMELSAFCQKKLEDAELQIKVLENGVLKDYIPRGRDGNPRNGNA